MGADPRLAFLLRGPRLLDTLGPEDRKLPQYFAPTLHRVPFSGHVLQPLSTAAYVGYGISIRVERKNAEKLIAHELVHVAQYERCGGMRNFLSAYIAECSTFGYSAAPMEREALELTKIRFDDVE